MRKSPKPESAEALIKKFERIMEAWPPELRSVVDEQRAKQLLVGVSVILYPLLQELITPFPS